MANSPRVKEANVMPRVQLYGSFIKRTDKRNLGELPALFGGRPTRRGGARCARSEDCDRGTRTIAASRHALRCGKTGTEDTAAHRWDPARRAGYQSQNERPIYNRAAAVNMTTQDDLFRTVCLGTLACVEAFCAVQ